uniref:Uncharacterized protein n=1 Tax=Cyprinus carpio TaxID=7962 RepID=A0A8C2PXS6_CYPCA
MIRALVLDKCINVLLVSSLFPEQFSMPIQCTEDTAEQAEVPFSSPLRSEVDNTSTSSSLASRGAGPDGPFFDSLRGLCVKFPPSTDDEYDFLNSTPDKRVDLQLHSPDLGDHMHTMREESYPSYSAPSHTSASSESHENVRGPQQYSHPQAIRDVDEFVSSSDLEKCSIASLAYHWSEWVPSERESKQLIKTSQ